MKLNYIGARITKKLFAVSEKIISSELGYFDFVKKPFIFICQKIIISRQIKNINHLEPIYVNDLSFENSSFCNAACTYCPHGTDSLKREKAIMKNEEFFRIIDICKKEGIEKISFGGLGEFLLDKRFLIKAKYVVDSGLKLSSLTTNGMLLDKNLSEELILLGMESITISIDSFEKDIYESIRVGLSFERVIKNLYDLLEVNEKYNNTAKINLNVTVTAGNRDEQKLIVDRFSQFFGKNFSISFLPLHNWAGSFDSLEQIKDAPSALKNSCIRIFMNNQAIVRSDGCLSICCNDYENEYSLGKVVDSVNNLWNSQKMVDLRKIHKEGRWDEVGICKNCSDIVQGQPSAIVVNDIVDS